MTKNLFKSKRFWSGIVALITGVSFIIIGDKTFEQVLPELVLTVFSLVQMIIAITSGQEIEIGGVNLSK